MENDMKTKPPERKTKGPALKQKRKPGLTWDQFEERVRGLQDRFHSSNFKNTRLDKSDRRILTLCFYLACRYGPLKFFNDKILDQQWRAEKCFQEKGKPDYNLKTAQRKALKIMGWSDGEVGKKPRLHPGQEWRAVSYYRLLLDRELSTAWGFRDETTGKPHTQARAAEKTFKQLGLKSSTWEAEKIIQDEIKKRYPKLGNVELSDKRQIKKIISKEYPKLTFSNLRNEFPQMEILDWYEEKRFLNRISKLYPSPESPQHVHTPDKDPHFEDLDTIISDFIQGL